MAIKDWKLGASLCFCGRLDREILTEFHDAGIKCVELSFSRDYFYNALDFVNKAGEYAALSRETGVELWSIHLPFSGELDVSNPDDAKRDFTIATNLELIEAAAKAGISVAVVHPSSEPIADCDRESRMERSIAALKLLAEKAVSVGMRLAVEDLPRSCLCHNSAEMRKVIESDPNINIVFDTNHLLIQDNIEFVRDVGERIISLHVSDYDFIDERHLLPFEGKIDWKALIDALDAKGYKGPWMYEVPSRGKLAASDLYENYRKLNALFE